MRLLCEIEDVFQISGRGYVITPGIPHAFPAKVYIKNKIILETPNGAKICSEIDGFESFCRGKPINHVPFSIPASVDKSFLLVGTKVWLVDSDPKNK
ncbi:hypothetical protein [Budvicia aquatica]|uniref:Uncharacterized protein n=1 Tax=Budvicia aquatica TaxID=82979 RepID=A0A2C6DKH1_9GAMM|nr:hypothetical protein [Budvicia aquatica]PHI29264.1 hypothetical protein CRN84_07995 [Budvicia aquatica]VFS47482.1 Uncharacterised protein [Budvicia aquatica]